MGGTGGGAEEREAKLAVPDGFALPSLAALDGVDVADRGDERLHAVYWDTPDLRLARAGVGLRHRNGTWTFKGISRREGDAVVREELEESGDSDAMPAPVRSRVSDFGDPADLGPVAEIDTIRHTIDLRGGDQRAELVHDRVRVLNDGRTVAAFTEVEVEFEETSSALADRVVRLVCAHGGAVDGTPKLVRALRALGYDPPSVEE